MRPVFFFILLSFFSAAPAQKAPARLQTEIDKLKNDPVLKHGNFGLCVMTADSGKIIAAHNSELCLTPASTLKVLTAGAALALLGESYRYTTTLEYDGRIDSASGTLFGNLYVRGSGDPTFGSQFFKIVSDTAAPFQMLWINALREKGIKKIEGRVISDATVFEDNPVPPGWVWSDMGNYYGAGAFGLNWIDNRYRIYFDSGAEGDAVKIDRIEPAVPGLRLDNQVISGGRKDDAFIYGAPYTYWQNITGSIPPNRDDYDVDGALPDPPMYFAQYFTEELRRRNITVTKEAETSRTLKIQNAWMPGKRTVIGVYQSPPLSDIIKHTLTKSDNMYTECLLKTLSLKAVKTGDDEEGISMVKNFWQSKGLNTEALFMNDGSGLSRSNAVTTTQLAKAMQIASRQTWFRSFVAGVNGSMVSLCKGTLAEKNLRAKTGYITRARGYTGYVKDKKGRLLVFAVLANNYNCSPTEMKTRLERILIAMAELE
ncbi:MAG: D-alanyl-D-alanine carboxypeptidase / D-alanyl-D-alanine-endopeptidase (penicillin-binding protein 4) [Bacteroidetes bacterium]|nr:MAG: D-alanyl-D-alanine carboxypeptidase / D-alanyl-D-alanine-endopeptidase (penicillin-binding protein 4) [Bacteroidota bacterium]